MQIYLKDSCRIGIIFYFSAANIIDKILNTTDYAASCKPLMLWA